MSIYRDNNPRTLEKPSILVGLMPFNWSSNDFSYTLQLYSESPNAIQEINCSYFLEDKLEYLDEGGSMAEQVNCSTCGHNLEIVQEIMHDIRGKIY